MTLYITSQNEDIDYLLNSFIDMSINKISIVYIFDSI